MSFDWREFLELARDLGRLIKRWVLARSGQTFGCKPRVLFSLLLDSQLCKDKTGLSRHEKHPGSRVSKRLPSKVKKRKLASGLNKLRLWHNRCDYDEYVPDLDRYAQQAIILAERAIKNCV